MEAPLGGVEEGDEEGVVGSATPLTVMSTTPPKDDQGCLSCSFSCLGTFGACLSLTMLSERLGGHWLLLQLILAAIAGALLGKLCVAILRRGRSDEVDVGCTMSALPVFGFLLLAVANGFAIHAQVWQRSRPGWGRADLATYQFPNPADYTSSLSILIFSLAWLVTTIWAVRRGTTEQRARRVEL
jgi:hypothetical protein